MKLLLIFLLTLSFNGFAQDITPGCQGEGCDCTRDKVTNKSLTLYQKMSTESKIIKKYKAKTKAELKGAFTKTIQKGSYKIVKVLDENVGLKEGQEFDTLFSEGEGFYNIKIKDKEFNFSYEQIEFQVQTPAKTETWYEIKVGKLKGYTNVFPFQGCLE